MSPYHFFGNSGLLLASKVRATKRKVMFIPEGPEGYRMLSIMMRNNMFVCLFAFYALF